VTLVEIGGKKIIKGGNNIARDITVLADMPYKLKERNISHVPEENARYSFYPLFNKSCYNVFGWHNFL
jgi:hypothetical protein